jgi:hypothetical protein
VWQPTRNLDTSHATDIRRRDGTPTFAIPVVGGWWMELDRLFLSGLSFGVRPGRCAYQAVGRAAGVSMMA